MTADAASSQQPATGKGVLHERHCSEHVFGGHARLRRRSRRLRIRSARRELPARTERQDHDRLGQGGRRAHALPHCRRGRKRLSLRHHGRGGQQDLRNLNDRLRLVQRGGAQGRPLDEQPRTTESPVAGGLHEPACRKGACPRPHAALARKHGSRCLRGAGGP